MADWHTVAKASEVDREEGKQVKVAGRSIAIFQIDGQFYAIGGECTHAGGPLAEGFIEGDKVICPLHGAEFEIKTGKVCSPPAGSDVACFRVRLDGDNIQIEL